MARILITSAIPYINGIKHLGNLIGSQLPSDLFARYLRQKGHEVMFICATDEHGTPAEIAAMEAGKRVDQYCHDMHLIQKDLANRFHLSFDYFGRSSSKQNHELTQYFAGCLEKNGFIAEVLEQQIYSIKDQRYLPDRYVRGECPACGYKNARGDQCENCTKPLEPTDLINPYSSVSGSKDLEIRETKHLYLRQSLFRNKLEKWIDSKKDWPILTTSIAKKWLFENEGLRDRGITRDLDWGIPVKKGKEPWPGMENKVFYVWFDAPIEYIAATAEWADSNQFPDSEWERWWRTDKGAEDVRYVQFMGKDNVPFHTLSFPVTIIGSQEPWKLVDYIKSFNFLNYEGGQFSTSLGRGIFMDQALDILPADYWRWWLLSHAPEHSDSEFTWDNFTESINNDLANVLGNFVSRVTKFGAKHFGVLVPLNNGWSSLEYDYSKQLTEIFQEYESHLDQIEIRKASQCLRLIWSLGNSYMQESEPWVTIKSDPEKTSTTINFSLNLINFFGIVSEPFIPETSNVMQNMFGTNPSPKWPTNITQFLEIRGNNEPFLMPRILFRKITADERDNWKAIFSGKRNPLTDE